MFITYEFQLHLLTNIILVSDVKINLFNITGVYYLLAYPSHQMADLLKYLDIQSLTLVKKSNFCLNGLGLSVAHMPAKRTAYLQAQSRGLQELAFSNPQDYYLFSD